MLVLDVIVWLVVVVLATILFSMAPAGEERLPIGYLRQLEDDERRWRDPTRQK
ncbi:MAG TPA: hypothetical protein VH951_09340 [Dehalococcoidia bacterium]